MRNNKFAKYAIFAVIGLIPVIILFASLSGTNQKSETTVTTTPSNGADLDFGTNVVSPVTATTTKPTTSSTIDSRLRRDDNFQSLDDSRSSDLDEADFEHLRKQAEPIVVARKNASYNSVSIVNSGVTYEKTPKGVNQNRAVAKVIWRGVSKQNGQTLEGLELVYFEKSGSSWTLATA